MGVDAGTGGASYGEDDVYDPSNVRAEPVLNFLQYMLRWVVEGSDAYEALDDAMLGLREYVDRGEHGLRRAERAADEEFCDGTTAVELLEQEREQLAELSEEYDGEIGEDIAAYREEFEAVYDDFMVFMDWFETEGRRKGLHQRVERMRRSYQ